ncbi:MAG: response regulator [Terriglobales bacterium]
MSIVRVLVVDDFEAFRRFVRVALGLRPDLQVIGEASDGLEAVQKAEELQPDLIVLDIGLPSLNGIEAARRILKFSGKSKILFLSQETSGDVAQEAFDLGAQGYVVKTHAGSELLAAVEAVLQGGRFISDGLSGHRFTDAPDAAAPDVGRNSALPSLVPRKSKVARSHEVEFYSDDAGFVAGFAYRIEAALAAGNAVIVVATESHRKSLLQKLREDGVDTAAAIKQGRYLPLDAAETLSTFMGNDLPDPVRFFGVVGNLIAAAARATAGEQSRVSICGECASILWAQGKADAAIEVERLCNRLSKRYEMEVLCGFPLSGFYREEDKQVFHRIAANIEPLSARQGETLTRLPALIRFPGTKAR